MTSETKGGVEFSEKEAHFFVEKPQENEEMRR